MPGRTFKIGDPAPAVAKRAHQVVVLAGAEAPRAKAIALFVFVRDSIQFGFTPKFDQASPEETLTIGRGHCNPQGALFASLLQAEGIPARQRFVNLSNGVLHGVLMPPPPRLVHSYVELQLPKEDGDENADGDEIAKVDENREWIRVDGYIVDPPLFQAAKAKLVKENRTEGYGIHVKGSNEWDGKSDSFCQMADERAQVLQDLGTFNEPRQFYNSRANFQKLPWPVRPFFRLIAAGANSAIASIRAEYVDPPDK